MAFDARRKYDAHLLLGTTRPWKPRVWSKLAACLAPVFGPPAKTAVRTEPKLGKLGWASARKWTSVHAFEDLAMWSPSWNDVERLGRPPNAFLHVIDPRVFGVKHRDGVASYVLLAVAVDSDVHAAAVAAIPALVKALAPVHHFKARRAWARRRGDAYLSSLQDLLLSLERDDSTGTLRPPPAWKPVRKSSR